MHSAIPHHVTFPLDEVRAAWRAGEISQKEISERVGRARSTVSRILSGGQDLGHEKSKVFYQALLDIRAERAARGEASGPALADEQFVRLYNEGASLQSLAEAGGVSVRAVRDRLSSLGVALRRSGGWSEAASLEAREAGFAVGTARMAKRIQSFVGGILEEAEKEAAK